MSFICPGVKVMKPGEGAKVSAVAKAISDAKEVVVSEESADTEPGEQN